MKIFLTLNEKILRIEPKKIFTYLSKYDETNIVRGFEIKLDKFDDVVFANLKMLVEYSKLHDKEIIFQATDIERDIQWHMNFLKFYASVAEKMGKKTIVTYASYLSNSKLNSYIKTKEILFQILNEVDRKGYNLDICIENLEYRSRLEVDDILKLLFEERRLGFTYDIGHEVLSERCNYSVPKNLENKIRNVHIHDVNNRIAHYPFVYGNIDLYATFNYLKSIGYNDIVTLEIYPNFLEGNTDEELMYSYITEAIKVEFIIDRC